ncbi:hypothetical protein [Nocardia sp. NPDC058114]
MQTEIGRILGLSQMSVSRMLSRLLEELYRQVNGLPAGPAADELQPR